MSAELKRFLHEKGVATSRTTPYNPEGNGQVERFNGTLWRAITLALHSKKWSTNYWELVLLDALHSIRSLLCTATNTTPHERFFSFNRRSTYGTTIPTWLTPGNLVLMKRQTTSKYDHPVEKVEIIDCNPQYAHVRMPDGREDTVSLKHLAPGESSESVESIRTPLSRHASLTDSPIEDTNTEAQPSSEQAVPQTPTSVPEPEKPENLDQLQKYQQRVRPYNLRNREA